MNETVYSNRHPRMGDSRVGHTMGSVDNGLHVFNIICCCYIQQKKEQGYIEKGYKYFANKCYISHSIKCASHMIPLYKFVAIIANTFLITIFFSIQRNDGVPQTDMSYYDEVEGAAGKVGCMTMKDNPSYSVPKVMCT